MAEGLNKRRAAALLGQAEATLDRDPAAAEQLALQVVEGAPSAHAYAVLAESKWKRALQAEALAVADEGLAKFRDDPTLSAWKGGALVRQRRPDEALPLLERARSKHGKDPVLLIHYAWALHYVGLFEKAETAARKAVENGGGPAMKLELAKLISLAGNYDAANALFTQLENKGPNALALEAKAARGDALLFMGDAAGAVGAWKPLDEKEQLPKVYLGHFAYAAQLTGDAALADELIARRTAEAGPEDLLLFGLIALQRGEPQAALERLEAARNAEGPRAKEFEYERLAAEGRALRLLGQSEPARAKLNEAAKLPEYGTRRLGPRARIDLSHLAAEEGDFETSERLLSEALQLDPGDPEALRAHELTRKRVAWKSEISADAAARVDAAKAEAEAMRRRFSSRESELEAEVRRARAAREEAERAAKEALEAAKAAQERAAEAERAKQAIEAQVEDSRSHTEENVARAFEGVESEVPPELRKGVTVAETTFQQSLLTDLPATPAAMMFASAVLERALVANYAVRFNDWLKRGGRLKAFLEGAVRSRGRRVEYFDKFVEAFDPEQNARAPGMGEIGRVLERRHESYLKPFRSYLAETFAAPDSFYADLAEFVRWTKETIRDPIAHGTIDELDTRDLRKLREQLMFTFGGQPRGVVAQMLEPKK
ncbi:MAG: tetratricopeptide repeat protein [Myxococcaceae bacterium]